MDKGVEAEFKEEQNHATELEEITEGDKLLEKKSLEKHKLGSVCRW